MSLAEASDTGMQVKTLLTDKEAKNGDEIEGQSVTEMSEFNDPAILDARVPKIRYSRDQLMQLRDAPLSQKKPDFLEDTEATPLFLGPENGKWNMDRKKSDTPTENGPTDKRRNGDPRERIRKENDGIVLSPQRRSFNSGCFVPVRETARPNRPHSPLGSGKNDANHMGVRDIPTTGTRRIGSGRILRDSWDFNDKSDGNSNNDFGGFRRQNSVGQNDNDDKFERRSFGRDFEPKEKDTRRNGRYNDRRRVDSSRDEEPEWFSTTITQNDTIELRGFDESEKVTRKKKLSPSRAKRAKEWSKKKSEAGSQPTVAEEREEGGRDRSTPNLQVRESSGSANTSGDVQEENQFNFDDILKANDITSLLANGMYDGQASGDVSTSKFSRWFKRDSPDKDSRRSSIHDDHNIIKDILGEISEPNVTIPGDSDSYFAPISPAGGNAVLNKGVNIMDMLQRGGQKTEEAPFKQQMGSKMLSLDELEAKMRQSADISSGIPGSHHQLKHQESHEDMTAFNRLLAQVNGGHAVPATNGPSNKNPPMSLLQMLNHSQQQDEARRHLMGGPQSPNVGPQGHHGGTSNPVNDIAMKIQQQQQKQQQIEMFNKLMNAQSNHLRASPIFDMGMQQSRELLNRPEAQAILQGLKTGDITHQQICQQLANPNLNPRQREMLNGVMKYSNMGGNMGLNTGNNMGNMGLNSLNSGPNLGPSPRVLSPVPPHHNMMYHQQFAPPPQSGGLCVSPLPPNAYCVSPIAMSTSPNILIAPAIHKRIPSPREIQIHTQNILQKALIKKKLEEQSENYKRKQEQHRGASPNPQGSKNVASPTPLAFTPTSVLRKMTADKDDGKENKMDANKPPGRALTGMRPQVQTQPQNLAPPQQQMQQWNQQFSNMGKQQGRPIVKSNPNNYQQNSTTPEQFFLMQQQQQKMLQQQQQAAQQRKISQQQQSNSTQQQYNMNNNQGGMSHHVNHHFGGGNQLTQQQLRAQHQQHARPVTSGANSGSQQTGFPPQLAGQSQQGNNAWQQFFNSAQQNSRTAQPPNSAPVGELSPTTTNQLARWFSPDLLERARGGELPSTAALAQVVSLEEIERRASAAQAPAVHN